MKEEEEAEEEKEDEEVVVFTRENRQGAKIEGTRRKDAKCVYVPCRVPNALSRAHSQPFLPLLLCMQRTRTQVRIRLFAR